MSALRKLASAASLAVSLLCMAESNTVMLIDYQRFTEDSEYCGEPFEAVGDVSACVHVSLPAYIDGGGRKSRFSLYVPVEGRSWADAPKYYLENGSPAVSTEAVTVPLLYCEGCASHYHPIELDPGDYTLTITEGDDSRAITIERRTGEQTALSAPATAVQRRYFTLQGLELKNPAGATVYIVSDSDGTRLVRR